MSVEEIAVPALSAAGGAAVAGLALKMVVQAWFKRQEDVGTKVDAMVVELARVSERVASLQRAEERVHGQDRALAIVQTQLEELRQDLNGVGHKVRTILLKQPLDEKD